MTRTSLAAMGAALFLSAGSIPVAAQQQPAQNDSTMAARLTVTRDTLQAILARTDSAAGTDTTKGDPKLRALSQQIRGRLSRGDFQAGDRIRLLVDSEPQLSDTFPVGPSQEVVLPLAGVVSLHGVLRSELQTAMTRELGRFLRDPVVRAWPLIRISVIGEVNKPGFYLLPPTAVVSDVLTAAGGPGQNAQVQKMWVERNGDRWLEGQDLEQVIAQGRTLDDANVRPGDKFVVPVQGQSNLFETVRTVSILLSIPITIYALTQIFKK